MTTKTRDSQERIEVLETKRFPIPDAWLSEGVYAQPDAGEDAYYATQVSADHWIHLDNIKPSQEGRAEGVTIYVHYVRADGGAAVQRSYQGRLEEDADGRLLVAPQTLTSFPASLALPEGVGVENANCVSGADLDALDRHEEEDA